MRLGKSARSALLVVHMASASVWLGVLVTLVSARWFTDAVMKPLLIAAPVCVASGVLLSLGTPWGLLRYRWLVGKWALVAFVTALAGTAVCVPEDSEGLRLVASVALSVALGLSVVRPWGKRKGALRGRHRARTAG